MEPEPGHTGGGKRSSGQSDICYGYPMTTSIFPTAQYGYQSRIGGFYAHSNLADSNNNHDIHRQRHCRDGGATRSDDLYL